MNCEPLSVMMRLGMPKRHTKPLMNLTADPTGIGLDRLHLRLLGELVDGDVEQTVAGSRAREGPKDIQPLDGEGPREGNGLEPLRWPMNLLGMELASLACLDQLRGILKCCGPVEAATERLACESA